MKLFKKMLSPQDALMCAELFLNNLFKKGFDFMTCENKDGSYIVDNVNAAKESTITTLTHYHDTAELTRREYLSLCDIVNNIHWRHSGGLGTSGLFADDDFLTIIEFLQTGELVLEERLSDDVLITASIKTILWPSKPNWTPAAMATTQLSKPVITIHKCDLQESDLAKAAYTLGVLQYRISTFYSAWLEGQLKATALVNQLSKY